MNRPLVVYLDSSDYSHFADVFRGAGTTSDEKELLALKQLVRQGDIQIPFSSLHVMEAAAHDGVSTEAATARLNVIDQLANGSAFRGWTELPALDLLHAQESDSYKASVRPVERERFHGRSSDGEWFPGLPLLFKEIGEMISAMHTNPTKAFLADPDNRELLAGMNRKQRRNLEAQSRRPPNPLAMRRMIESDWAATYARLRTRFPVSVKDSDIWKRFVLSSKPDHVPVYKSFRNGFSDLSFLATYLLPGQDSLNDNLTKWLRDSSVPLIQNVTALNELRRRWRNIPSDSFKIAQKRPVVQDARDFQARWL
ncbi:MAG: hypothetical protein ACRDAM_00945, partial [Casimicrobium sp.]